MPGADQQIAQRRPDSSCRLIEWKPWLFKNPSLLGHCSVAFAGGWHVHRIPVFRKGDGSVGVGAPDAADVDGDGKIKLKPDGKKSYWKIITFETTEARERWQRMIQTALVDAGVGGCALAEADRDRLARLLGMLGSAFDGEVANAGRLADKLVRGAGLSWPDIIAPALPSPEHEHCGDTAADPLRGDWRAMAATCTRFPHLIDKWEWQFLGGLHRFPRLSAKQRTILIRIVVRLRAANCSL